MLLRIPGVLTQEQLGTVRKLLANAPFVDGKLSAGSAAKRVKNNEELDKDALQLEHLNNIVMGSLVQHPLYRSAALPLRVAAPYYARYTPGRAYGEHVDDPIMGIGGELYRSDIAITVFDDRGLGNGLLLPAGPLREPAGPLRELAVKTSNSLVLHTGNHAVKLTNTAAPQFTARRALASYVLRADGSKVDFEELKRQTNLLALAGIANPEAFFDMLRGQGLNLAKTIALPDHVDFSYDFNSYIGNEYASYTLICTVKDAVKLWCIQPALNLQILAIPLEFEPETAFFTAFDALLQPLLKPLINA